MTLMSCEGNILASGIGNGFDSGFGPVNENVCLKVGMRGLVVEVGGGDFPEDASWSLTFPSGIVETGRAGSLQIGSCVYQYPSLHPTFTAMPLVTAMPTASCDPYILELYDAFGDG